MLSAGARWGSPYAYPGGAKRGHEGHSRALHENPDEIIDHSPNFALSAWSAEC